MKKWIFTGICDKSDLLLYMCKILAHGDKRVLLVDAALDAKYRYCIGNQQPQLPVTEFAGFDVAGGFDTLSGLELHLLNEDEKDYDYILMDVERTDFLQHRDWMDADACIWVSGFDVTSLKRSAALLEELKEQWLDQTSPSFHRVYLNVIEDMTDEAYIEGYLNPGGMAWQGQPVKMPWDELFFGLKIQNEHAGRLVLKPLSRHYKRALIELILQLSEWDRRHVRRAMRHAERRRA